MSIYTVGQVARLSAKFRQDAADIDPSTVALKVKAPDGTVVTHTYPADIAKAATGYYTFDLVLAQSGTYWQYWYSSGNAQTAAEGSIVVAKSNVV